jgi:MFS family permease
MVDRFGRRVPMIVGSALCAVLIGLFAHAGTMGVLPALLAAHALGGALLGTAPAAVVGDEAGPGGDRAVALFSMSSDTGAILGPLAAGFLSDRFGFWAAFASGAVFWLAACVLAVAMPRATARRS